MDTPWNEPPRNEHSPIQSITVRSVSRSAAMSMKADLELSIRLRPKNARTCYVCGPDNARGLQGAFLADRAHGRAALYPPGPPTEGGPRLLRRRAALPPLERALRSAGPFPGRD